jgi:hypothetical protein
LAFKGLILESFPNGRWVMREANRIEATVYSAKCEYPEVYFGDEHAKFLPCGTKYLAGR